MIHPYALLAALAACLVTSCAPGQRSAPPREASPPASLAEAELARLNRWCAGQDDCDVSERPGAYPGRVAHGETNGFILSSRERLAALGAGAAWDPRARRFVLTAAPAPRPVVPAAVLPQRIDVTVEGATEWVPVAAARALPGSTSAVAVRRAVDPVTGKPYEPTYAGMGGDPHRLRRGFRVDQPQVLVGEPLLVELRVEVDGTDTWLEAIGGNYRGRGRDDNLRFVLRRADGTFVADPYPGRAFSEGGKSSRQSVTAQQPFSYFAAVQQYAALDRPGTYDLYCFHAAHGWNVVGWRQALAAAIPAALRQSHRLGQEGNDLVEIATGKTSAYHVSPSWRHVDSPSPVGKAVPADVARHVGPDTLNALGDYAHFRIVVKAGTAVERRRMVSTWTQVVATPAEPRWPTARADAARRAMWFARQDDFLPLLARWLKGPPEPAPQDLHGLALRPGAAATRLLLRSPSGATVSALRYAHPTRIKDIVPTLIDWLVHPTAAVRAGAEDLLVAWTGERQGRTWEGYRNDRPTLEEGQALQARWRKWWQGRRARLPDLPRAH